MAMTQSDVLETLDALRKEIDSRIEGLSPSDDNPEGVLTIKIRDALRGTVGR
jgi:hypothetical protein